MMTAQERDKLVETFTRLLIMSGPTTFRCFASATVYIQARNAPGIFGSLALGIVK